MVATTRTHTPTATLQPQPPPTGVGTWSGDRALDETLKSWLDPARFARRSGFNPDPWQTQFLQSSSKRRMLNCSRQVGKSTVVAYGAVHRAVYKPDRLILLLSPGERQSGELMRKVRDVMANAPDVPKLKREGALSLEYVNGSRIEALPGKEGTVRGYSAVDLLVVDEASRVPNDLFLAIQPMLAVSEGDLWTLSTPFGTRGWWYEQYKQLVEDTKLGRPPEWDYYEVPATMSPRITKEFLAKERRTLGEWWYTQEYMCIFLDAQSAAFGAAEIDAAFDEEVIPWRMVSDTSLDDLVDAATA